MPHWPWQIRTNAELSVHHPATHWSVVAAEAVTTRHSDTRLLPRASRSSTHRFAATCEAPEVRAVLVHRAFPLELAQERGWAMSDSIMVEAQR